MRHSLIFICLLLCLCFTQFAQAQNLPVMEKLAEFPGGTRALREYLQKNIKFPEQARKKSVSGSVLVRFTVDSNGFVSAAEVVQSTNGLFDGEALRVVNTFPRFSPAVQNGKKIAVKAALPINFRYVAAGQAPPPIVEEPKGTKVSQEYLDLPDYDGWYPLVDRRTADFNKLVIRTPQGKLLEKSDRYFIFLEIPFSKYNSLDEVINTAISPSPTVCKADDIKVLEERTVSGIQSKMVLAQSPSCQTSGTTPAARSCLVYAQKGRDRYYLQYVYFWNEKFPEADLEDWRNFLKLSQLKYTQPSETLPELSQAALDEVAKIPELQNAYLLVLGPEWPKPTMEAKTLGNVRRVYRRDDEVKEGCEQILVVESQSIPPSKIPNIDTLPETMQAEFENTFKRVKVAILDDYSTADGRSMLFRMSADGLRGAGCSEKYQYIVYVQALNYERHVIYFGYPSRRPNKDQEDAWINKLKSGRFVPAE